MSFLSKLKERLFKSSSKIEEGLETIMEDTSSPVITKENNASEHKQDVVSSSALPFNKQKILEDTGTASNSKSFISKLIKNNKSSKKQRIIDDKLLESLEDLLISADLGVSTAMKITASFGEIQYGRKLSMNEIKLGLANEVKKILDPVSVPIGISKGVLQVVLVVGVNGSGKHNNWSLATNTGINLLSPGKTPMSNLQFLTFFINTIKAVHEYEELLRASIASASNDHRLGANEAPPAIISVFIGEQLTKVLNDLESVTKGKLSPKENQI